MRTKCGIGVFALLLLSEYAAAEMIERPPKAGELPAHPADGDTVGVNPPAFCWTRIEKAVSYRLEVRGAQDSTPVLVSREPLKSTVYPPYQRLVPGNYVWQVIYLDATGAAWGTSRVRHFTVPQTVPSC